MTHPVKNHFGQYVLIVRGFTQRHKQYAHLGQAFLDMFFAPRDRDGAGVVGGGSESKNTEHLAFASGHIGCFCCGKNHMQRL